MADCQSAAGYQPAPQKLLVVVAAGGFANDVLDDFGGARRVEVGGHAVEGDAENVAVMQFGPGAAGAEFQPEAVDQVNIFGP